MRMLGWVGLMLLASPSFADRYGYGQGSMTRVISSADVVVNRSLALLESVPAGASVVRVAGPVVAGELVLLHQSSIDAGVPTSEAGRYLFRRVTGVTGDALTLDQPLEHGFLAPGAQVVVVAEYRQLTIEADAGLAAPGWDGTTGGVLAVFVDGTLTNHGQLNATGRGQRGSPQTLMVGDSYSCTQAEAQPGVIYAPRGEGFIRMPLGLVGGLAPSATGGGSGGCSLSGGGGGAGTGSGGRGGNASVGDLPGGAGGVGLTTAGRDRFVMGGGGGCGSAASNFCGAGGAGGGIVIVRARSVTGNGVFAADGLPGGCSPIGGCGGGGGGGTLIIWSERSLQCQLASAAGASGGSGTPQECNGVWVGPGGGGGGGRLWLKPGGCPTRVTNGVAGTSSLCNNTSRRFAEPLVVAPPYVGLADEDQTPYLVVDAGVADAGLPDAGTLAVRPYVWERPADGERLGVRRPVLVVRAQAGEPVAVSLDGTPLRTVMADVEGRVQVDLEVDLSDGVHLATATGPATTASIRFIVDTAVPEAPLIRTPSNRSVLRESPGLIAGTAEPSRSIEVLLDGEPVGTTVADAMGRWTLVLEPAPQLAPGAHTLDATARSASGRVGTAEQVVFSLSVDAGPPRVGASCQTVPTSALALLALLVLRRVTRRCPT